MVQQPSSPGDTHFWRCNEFPLLRRVKRWLAKCRFATRLHFGPNAIVQRSIFVDLGNMSTRLLQALALVQGRELNSNSSVHSQGIRHQQKQFHGKPACSQLCPQHTLHAMGPQDLQLALHGQLKPPTIMVHAPESCTRCFRNTARKRHAGGSGWAARSASVYRGRRSVLKG